MGAMDGPEKDTYEHYEPVSLGPAASGWRALYIDDDESEVGFFTQPLVSWGVFHLTVRRGSTVEVVEDHGNVIEGVVADYHPSGGVGGLVCAAEHSNFRYYLDQEAPEPTPGAPLPQRPTPEQRLRRPRRLHAPQRPPRA
jgi:hypothetical protein